MQADFKGNKIKGNKRALPTKMCCVCQRPMSWRKSWAKNWAEVKYCSDACRKRSKQDHGEPVKFKS
ncbi:MAG: hypothetical protein RI949_1939 [Pseudomonadota bacterium]|nr:DUF2256 domain-containing protein [Betaproteobacteria bacterium]